MRFSAYMAVLSNGISSKQISYEQSQLDKFLKIAMNVI